MGQLYFRLRSTHYKWVTGLSDHLSDLLSKRVPEVLPDSWMVRSFQGSLLWVSGTKPGKLPCALRIHNHGISVVFFLLLPCFRGIPNYVERKKGHAGSIQYFLCLWHHQIFFLF